MKIGMLTSSVSRKNAGIYEAMRLFSNSLQTHTDCNVTVFGLRDCYTDADRGTWGNLDTKSFNIKGPNFFGYAPSLYDSLVNAQLDLIHLHGIWMYPSVACMRWSRKTSQPYIISPHGMLDPWAFKNSRWKKNLAKTFYEGRNLKGAACLQAGSVSEYQAIRDLGLTNPVCILPNGIHLPSDISAVSQKPWDKLVPGNSKVLLFLGRLHPKKGLNNLLHAWQTVTRNNSVSVDWQLVIAGVGAPDYQEELLNLSRSLSLSSSVCFIGPQYHEEKDACFRSASAFILPSFSEGMPMAVLDAWSFGLPVLMTPQCNLPVGFEAQAALEIKPEVESITQGLIALFAMSDQERLALGKRGRLLAGEQFNWETIANQMLSVYDWMLGKESKPECVIID